MAAQPAGNKCDWQSILSGNRIGARRPSTSEDNQTRLAPAWSRCDLNSSYTSALAAAAFIGIAQWAGRMTDLAGGHRLSGMATGLMGAALFPASFIVLLVTNSFGGAVAFAILYGIASGMTAVARATLPLEVFPAGAYARSSARMSVPLNFAFAAAPPTFTAIMTSASSQATLWLALTMSVFAFVTLLYLSLVHRKLTTEMTS